jgi:2-methylisocitrate lyase-like PEP mutase family enzyme
MSKKKTTQLRELIERDEIVLRPHVAIALQAMMAEAAGFEMVSVSGAHEVAHILGLPDAGLITLTEKVENTRRVCNAVSIPVMGDCDTGFGNAINVRRTVQQMYQAGAAGIFIEDQVAPKRCGFVKGKELISLEEAVGKFRAAVDMRNELDKDFIIMARTDARTAVGGSLEEAIRRARTYREEAGVDVSFVEALQSREEIKQARAAIDGPLVCSPQAIQPTPTLKELQELGMCMAAGIMFFKVGYVAWWDMLVAMKQNGLEPWIEWSNKNKEHPMMKGPAGLGVFDLVGFPKVREWEEKYLPKENLEKYDKSIGLYDPGSGHS